MKVLLLGGAGMLAADLLRSAPEGATLTPRDRDLLDVTDRDALARALDELAPELVVNASAYTAVDRAESERELAFAVNGTAVGHLAALSRARGIPLVHYSTDYVFPGDAERPYREDDPVAPVNAYGESKLAGERAIAASGADALVIRTQWLFGVNGRSFPRTMWERARAGQVTRVVDDQYGLPTYTVDLARATWALLARGARRVVHVANAGAPVTWHTLARRVFERAGRPELLTPCATSDYPTPARRPRHSALATERATSLLGAPLPAWTNAVDRFLEELDRGD